MIQKLLFKLFQWLKTRVKPSDLDLVTYLILHTHRLELQPGQSLELAPVKGCCGPFKLSGNSLPVFEYVVFDACKDRKAFMMEFVKVKVEISKPDRISYSATIEAQNLSDKKRHGEEVEVKEFYKVPFQFLAWHLYQYFPFSREAEIANQHAKVQETYGARP